MQINVVPFIPELHRSYEELWSGCECLKCLMSSHCVPVGERQKDLLSADEALNNSLGRLGRLVEDTAGATQALSRGVSNEAKYVREALDTIDDFQRRTSWRGSASQGSAEVILVERQQ